MSDYNNYKSFQKLIAQANFNLSGEALIQAALLMDWFNKQEKRFKPAPIIEEKKEAINEL